MLKWFRAKGPHQAEIVTDDPLATIRTGNAAGTRRPLEIYAVSRVNPLFYDGGPQPEPDSGEPQPKDAAKEGSSGYDSNIYNSSSECSSGADSGGADSGDAQQQTVLRRDAVTVLEQDVGFVQSILVAVRGGSPGSAKKKHSRKASGSSSSAPLSPIPEGAVDYCIPRPVWPPGDSRHGSPTRDPIVDDALLLYTRLSCTPALPIPRVGARYSPPDTAASKGTGEMRVDTHLVLRQLSETINRALESREPVSHDALLRSLSETISRGLDSVARSASSASSEEALKRLSYTLSQSDRLTRMTRALSNSSGGSSGGSSVRGVSRKLLANSTTSPATSDGAVASSSSSAASSSGFSDCTRTPSSTASSSESPSSRRGQDLPNPPVFASQDLSKPPLFVHGDLAGVPTSTRNALLYGGGAGSGSSAQCRTSVSAVSVGYEKLVSVKQESATAGASSARKKVVEEDESLWETFCGAGVTEGDVRLKSDGCYHHHWSPDRPDFTLDMPRSERLMRKIKAAKTRRCWCHFITSLVGLIFFLVSVMVVSLMLTRGKRIFGSL